MIILDANTRRVGTVWAIAVAITLIASLIASNVYGAGQLMKGYLIGLIGLLALGGALAFTWHWLRTAKLSSRKHQMAKGALTLATFLWAILMIFPFL
ncbi:MAG: hypothetical protein H0W63_11845 [Gemmatimonadaceae bacterium]|nr:hypothetical protein [Gemmatimonadaceae bacterium]